MTITIILVIIIAGAGYAAYSYYGEYSKKSEEVETLKTEIASLEVDVEKAETVDEVVGGCDHGLTSDEEATVSTWDTYTSSSYDYSFQYPSDWMLDVLSPAKINVSGEIDGSEGAFNVYSAEAAIMGFGGYVMESQGDFEIDCQTETLINFSFDTNGRIQVASFYNDSTQHVTMFSHEYTDASQDADMIDLGELFLKTMKLN